MYLGLSDMMVFNQEMKQYDFGIVVDQYTYENFTRDDSSTIAKIKKERKENVIAKTIAKSGRPVEGSHHTTDYMSETEATIC